MITLAITMVDDNNDTHEKLWFPVRIRELRIAAGKTQKQVAAVLGIKGQSYGNAESSNHKRISRDRAAKLAVYYQLSQTETAELLAGWEALPQGEFKQREAASYEKNKAYRSKARNYDRLKLSLLEMTTLYVTIAPDPETLCACSPVDMFSESPSGQDQDCCELCSALRLLGLTGWTNLDEVVAKLAAIQEGMTG
jgi:transcriptional regulator with XRE-family HTH domain